MNPNKKRLRRTMMFLNAQKPGLIKDPYIYKPDSIMLDLEDAVAENQKDAARFSLYHALKTINYRGCERVVRINGLDTPYWKEDIRCAVACGCVCFLNSLKRFLVKITKRPIFKPPQVEPAQPHTTIRTSANSQKNGPHGI